MFSKYLLLFPQLQYILTITSTSVPPGGTSNITLAAIMFPSISEAVEMLKLTVTSVGKISHTSN